MCFNKQTKALCWSKISPTALKKVHSFKKIYLELEYVHQPLKETSCWVDRRWNQHMNTSLKDGKQLQTQTLDFEIPAHSTALPYALNHQSLISKTSNVRHRLESKGSKSSQVCTKDSRLKMLKMMVAVSQLHCNMTAFSVPNHQGLGSSLVKPSLVH